ncbi:uncharacterized protein LOC134230751 [Saccostrea cucullata]|uniref:uncharacterized protein LOC134230751 n=1 Tax=Saccostrea cuccullata TaxID=36930 RepID=UPI002ED339FB
MSSNSSGQSIKFSVEFRDTVYRINPDYLSCKHKVLFEDNATDTLRDQGSEPHLSLSTDFADGRKSFSDITKSDSPSKSVSNIEETFSDSAIRTLHSKHFSNDRKGLRGWEVCLRTHSAQSCHYRKLRSDHKDLQRSRSLSAKINSTRREKFKVSKISIFSPGTCSSRLSHRDSLENTNKKDNGHAHSSSASLIRGSYYCTPGYVTTIPKPISYKFKHFEYTSNYIEQYRNEYTYPRLVEPPKPPPSGSCNCEVKGEVIPGKQPEFQWVEQCQACSRHQQEGHSSSGLTINSISSISTSSQGPDRSRQTPHHLLAHNGVLKTEFYNNPLMIDNTKLERNKTPALSRNRPSILSTVRPVLHPNSSVALPVKRPTYQPQSHK